MAWADATAYSEAVQNPRLAFRDAELHAGELATNRLGLPLIHSGNFAAVFQMRRPAGPPHLALKCFTRQVHGLRHRYQQIDVHLNGRRLPFMVDFAYQDEGILIGQQRYPLLKMDWVQGLRLDQFLEQRLGQPGAKRMLRELSRMWLRLSEMLREAEIGHGDLQHGNVMLVPVPGTDNLALKLIDYDGMYVPELAGHPPGEIGHPAYQHPGRTSKTGYGPEVDRFSHLVIYTTLQALVVGGRELWDRFYNGDRLLLGPDDFRDPENSEAFRTLWQIDDPDVQALTGYLGLAATEPIDRVPLLSDLVTDFGVEPLSKEQHAWLNGMFQPLPSEFGKAKSVAFRDVATADQVIVVEEPSDEDQPSAEPVAGVTGASASEQEFDVQPTKRRSWPGRLISGADRVLVRVVGEENTILLAVLRPLAALVGLALPLVFLLVLFQAGLVSWQVALQLASRWSAPPAPLVATEEPVEAQDPLPPEIAPAVYQARVVPAEAVLSGNGKGVTIDGEGSERTVKVESPDGKTRLILLTLLEGYENSRKDLLPISGVEEEIEMELVPLPAVYHITLHPAEAKLNDEPAGVKIENSGSRWTVTVESPDEYAKIELVASLSGYSDERFTLRPEPGQSQERTITLQATTITNSIGMRFQRIPAGEYLMGSPDSYRGARDYEKPQHRVRITRPFYLGVYEVTQGEYERVMGSNPSHFKGDARLPVEMVSWQDAMTFCERLSALSAERSAGRVYRLPTEAEWEYACRAGSTTIYSFGDSEASLGDYAWYRENSGRKTHPVGQKRPNAWGLYDMHGNVWEWCSDWADASYYASSPVDDPTGPGKALTRVLRGGSWAEDRQFCRSANRGWSTPGRRRGSDGFRVALGQSSE